MSLGILVNLTKDVQKIHWGNCKTLLRDIKKAI